MTRTAPAPSSSHASTPVDVVGVALFSARPEQLAAFYTAVFGVVWEQRLHDSGSEHWVSRLGSGVRLEIKAMHAQDGSRTPDWAVADRPEGISRAEIALSVPDVADAMVAAIGAGAHAHTDPVLHPWGHFAVLVDPDGNRIALYSPNDGSN